VGEASRAVVEVSAGAMVPAVTAGHIEQGGSVEVQGCSVAACEARKREETAARVAIEKEEHF
jgi:hypothetical protein